MDTKNATPALPDESALFGDVAGLIDGARARAAAAVNSELVMLYWSVGKRIREEVLCGERAAYGQDVVKRLAARLTERFGRGWGWRNLFRMVLVAEAYPEPEILSPLAAKLTWTNICEVLAIADQQKRDFYLCECARGRWSKRALHERIASKLYERTFAGGAAAPESPVGESDDVGSSPLLGAEPAAAAIPVAVVTEPR